MNPRTDEGASLGVAVVSIGVTILALVFLGTLLSAAIHIAEALFVLSLFAAGTFFVGRYVGRELGLISRDKDHKRLGS